MFVILILLLFLRSCFGVAPELPAINDHQPRLINHQTDQNMQLNEHEQDLALLVDTQGSE